MARKPRLHYIGALYYVMVRGNGGQNGGVRLCIVVFGMGYVIKLSPHGTETKTALYRRFISRDGAR